MITSQPAHPFDLLMRQPEQGFRLAVAALLIAYDHDPRGVGDLRPWLDRLDRLAQRVAAFGAQTAWDQIVAIRTVLVDEEALHGNSENYYDPGNSLLHRVLETGQGIPISLSVVWLDIAEQLQWRFEGVGFPGHFMVRALCPVYGEELYVDPFHGGTIMNRAECKQLIESLGGHTFSLRDEHFQASGKRQILSRMLHNLYGIFSTTQQWSAAARVLLRLLALHPDSPELRGRIQDAQRRTVELN